MALRITARMCIGASEGASGFAALRRAAPPHSPSALLASGLVTYAQHVMQNAMWQRGVGGNLGLRGSWARAIWIGDGCSQTSLSRIAISRAISDFKSGVSAGRLGLVLVARRSSSVSFEQTSFWPLLCESRYVRWIARYWEGEQEHLSATHMALRITARMCIGASEGASGFAALQRAAAPHSPSALLASGLVTYARHVMRHCTSIRLRNTIWPTVPLPRMRFAKAVICSCIGGLPEWITVFSAPLSMRHPMIS